ncbi:LysM peptidoglycan-binding domain-containing protein [Marinobacterium arenosum]|uniref:LysM peptidoglycan-binding domain-containing protein n=1 Tax=Marinobacterium arenosum TaxID=2862496 RepID=UPI001C98903E|nr:LysM peptidoglycan-binding domain-containing protein [Marinobacterium arenosum]MBY4678751.1 LysM peptidoglycan-binding domain-containing protein [Marinobacterium arenosum]
MFYDVKPGDTLNRIAERFNLSVDTLAQTNGIDDPNRIQVGQRLQLPATAEPPTEAIQTALTGQQLQQIMPQADPEDIARYLVPLNKQMARYGIDTPLRRAHFLAQIGHESGQLRFISENLNYSSQALRTLFSKYFPTEEMAEQCARQPQVIADILYANRMGNGPADSNDGWTFRGRGLIQLTGKDNYRSCGEAIGIDLLAKPQQLADEPNCAAAGACWFWQSRNLNPLADRDDVRQITRRINGGYNGLADREALLARAKEVLQV